MSIRSFNALPVLPTLPALRRRWFLGALLTSGLLGWAARADAKAAVKRSSVLSRPQQGKSAMPPALSAFIDHLIPADDLTPAASALNVPGDIWQQAQDDANLLRLISAVCAWMDRYGEGFAALQFDEREVLVKWMSIAPWESPQRRFFHLIRDRAFTLYYTQAVALKGLSIQRPPQPIGHELD